MLWNAHATNLAANLPEPLSSLFPPWVISGDGAALAATTRGEVTDRQGQLVVVDLSGSRQSSRPRQEHLSAESPDSTLLAGLSPGARFIPVGFAAGGHELLTVQMTGERLAELRSWNIAVWTNRLVDRLSIPLSGDRKAAPTRWTLSADRRWLACGGEEIDANLWRLNAQGRADAVPLPRSFEAKPGVEKHPRSSPSAALSSRLIVECLRCP
jgi:hypothetical protein